MMRILCGGSVPKPEFVRFVLGLESIDPGIFHFDHHRITDDAINSHNLNYRPTRDQFLNESSDRILFGQAPTC